MKKKKFTLNNILAGTGLAGRAKSFSTPPVSFQCMSLLVGGAKSSVVTMSVVSDSCDFISSPEIFLTSSTMSFLFLLAFVNPEKKERKNYFSNPANNTVFNSIIETYL